MCFSALHLVFGLQKATHRLCVALRASAALNLPVCSCCCAGLFLLMLRHDPAPLNPCTRGMQISERARTPVLPRSSDVLKAQPLSSAFKTRKA
ncbi:hypothetical protein DWQ65_00205 [Treponema phagedenis]|nr:hypothetical protein DWQ65_00205 [Treponema phagedenis]